MKELRSHSPQLQSAVYHSNERQTPYLAVLSAKQWKFPKISWKPVPKNVTGVTLQCIEICFLILEHIMTRTMSFFSDKGVRIQNCWRDIRMFFFYPVLLCPETILVDISDFIIIIIKIIWNARSPWLLNRFRKVITSNTYFVEIFRFHSVLSVDSSGIDSNELDESNETKEDLHFDKILNK